MSDYEAILEFWFGSHADDGWVAAQRAKLWWGKEPAADAEMRRRFENDLAAAAGGRLQDWQNQPESRLALILLTDQFPRGIYRDSARAFAYDRYALDWAMDGIALAMDQQLRPIERAFFYLPLEHAESLEHQNRCVALFDQLAAGVRSGWRETFQDYAAFAKRHREIIVRFGRFPHRNPQLGRESTPEELEFLRQPGSSF